jgi:hypothetical protein
MADSPKIKFAPMFTVELQMSLLGRAMGRQKEDDVVSGIKRRQRTTRSLSWENPVQESLLVLDNYRLFLGAPSRKPSALRNGMLEGAPRNHPTLGMVC